MAVLLVGADGDGTLLFDGLDGIDQEIHEYLVEFHGVTGDLGDLAVVFFDCGLVFEFIPDDVERALEPAVEIGRLSLLLVHVGEFLQGQHDFAHPLGAVGRFDDEVIQVFEDVFQVYLLFLPGNLVQNRLRLCSLSCFHPLFQVAVGLEQGREFLDVFAKGSEIADDEADRVVDLVGHARGQLADGGQLLRLQQLGLGLLQFVIGRPDLPRPFGDDILQVLVLALQLL